MRRPLLIVAAVLAAIVGWANWPGSPLPASARADRVLVDKSERTLSLLSGDSVLRSYRVSFGANPAGPKRQEGDERTPEGTYLLDRRNPRSSFHRALHVSYPDARDVERARARGVSPGGDIMIHGMRNGAGWIGKLHRVANWTDGCIALTDAEIEEVWRVVPDSTPIEIRP